MATYVGLVAGGVLVCFMKYFSFLDYTFIKTPKVSLWSLSHLIIYFIIGKLCQNKYLLFFLFGVLWEIFEKIYGHLTNDEVYWTGGGYVNQFSDICMNMLGYHLAHIV